MFGIINNEFIETNKNCQDPNNWIHYTTVYQAVKSINY